MIPIYKPYLTKKSLSYAHEALDSTWISSQGKYIQIVQEKLQELLNVKYVLPLNNGTSACHLLAKSIKFKYGINEIIVPDNVYVAAWNAFLFDGDFTLHGIPCNINTWNIDLSELDIAISKHPNAAVLVVHNIGNIINVPELKRKYPNTVFVEDNCEGFLGSYENKQSGTESYASAISFFGNKNITAGEGGGLITNDEDTYSFTKCIQGQGQSSKRFIHDHLGYNYRMTNVQAAILYGQLEILPTILEMKKSVFHIYRDYVKDREDVFVQEIGTNTAHANWMFGMRIPKQDKYQDAETYFNNAGIEVRPMFFPMTKHTHLVNNNNVHFSDCKNATQLNKECLILPSYPELTKEESLYILETLDKYIMSKGL